MSDVILDEQNLINIADVIREKLGVQTEYLPSEMASAIESIGGILSGTTPPTENTPGNVYLQIREHGTLNSDGASYIDSGVYMTSMHKVECEFAMIRQTTDWDTIFGCRNGQVSRFVARFRNAVNGEMGVMHSATPTTNYEASGDDTGLTKSMCYNTYQKIEVQSYYLRKGIALCTFTSGNTSAFPMTLYLFANHDPTTENEVVDYAGASMKYLRIYDENGKLIRYFVPQNNGTMYDMVTGETYQNLGSGNFSYVDSNKRKSIITWIKESGIWVPYAEG